MSLEEADTGLSDYFSVLQKARLNYWTVFCKKIVLLLWKESNYLLPVLPSSIHPDTHVFFSNTLGTFNDYKAAPIIYVQFETLTNLPRYTPLASCFLILALIQSNNCHRSDL